MKYIVFTTLLLFCAPGLRAQKFPEHPDMTARNTGKVLSLHVTAGVHTPAGDMADRFGVDGDFGGAFEFMTAGNYLFGAEGHYFFGNKVKDDPLAILRTPEGDIIGNDRLIASVALRERGYYIGGMIGKLITFSQKRSGIRLTLGAGVTRHRIRVQDDSDSVTQLTGEYKNGYDRLCGGIALNQFIGWQHLGATRRSNWMAGFEFNEGFTQTLRDWDFTEMRKLDGKRTDLRIGIRIAWTLPFYQGGADKIYY
ncbi:MAG: hypothetical protein IPK76_16905 [Lewinellaceae bacterium]|jgi:hypothetical protein|nr:hypothetical protein [Lewinellaceae bacterium]